MAYNDRHSRGLEVRQTQFLCLVALVTYPFLTPQELTLSQWEIDPQESMLLLQQQLYTNISPG